MNYTKPSFSVNPSEAKAPKDCQHGWVNQQRGTCVLCGEKVQLMALPKRPPGWYDPTVPYVGAVVNRRDL
jgi:hypothetical protein